MFGQPWGAEGVFEKQKAGEVASSGNMTILDAFLLSKSFAEEKCQERRLAQTTEALGTKVVVNFGFTTSLNSIIL